MLDHVLSGALAALYARVPLGMRLGLDAMRDACARAGHPERSFDVVHVAGTNGKGSVAAMVESIARAAGARTGLYTSPHLCRFAERIRIGGEPIADHRLARLLDEALDVGRDLSFFETATLAAFLAFREEKVDLAVVEVGIGGRLDATNVLRAPRCAAVTRVALDHQDRLGDTIEAIAREKAAIAKPGAPIVVGEMPEAARETVSSFARGVGARVVFADARDLDPDLSVGLHGPHQRANAAVAMRVAEELGIHAATRAAGLAAARWPGRLERFALAPGGVDAALAGPFVLDGAHNPDGVDALVAALANEPPGAIVFGALSDKAWPEMLSRLAALPAPRFYVAPSGRAPADPRELARVRGGQACASLEESLQRARRAAGPSAVLVCGSLYLVGEARARLLRLPTDPPVAL